VRRRLGAQSAREFDMTADGAHTGVAHMLAEVEEHSRGDDAAGGVHRTTRTRVRT
jgi:hypothetical protein